MIEAGPVYGVANPILLETPSGDATFVGTPEVMLKVNWGFFAARHPASNSQKRSSTREKRLSSRCVFSK